MVNQALETTYKKYLKHYLILNYCLIHSQIDIIWDTCWTHGLMKRYILLTLTLGSSSSHTSRWKRMRRKSTGCLPSPSPRASTPSTAASTRSESLRHQRQPLSVNPVGLCSLTRAVLFPSWSGLSWTPGAATRTTTL